MSRDNRTDVIEALGAAFRAHQRAVDRFDEAAAAHLGVNRSDLNCIDVLLERGVATPGTLAEALGLTSGSITALLDRLERSGFVEREPDPADRRRYLVRPTRKAVTAVTAVWGPLVEEGQRLLERYSVADLKRILDFLQRDRALQEAHAARVGARRVP